jgi:transcriptional regulator with XRE-family HTH domain
MTRSGVLEWHIGDVVRKLREACGLSRNELADRAGIRPNTLGEVERNVSNFERETLAKVAIALNVTVEGLYAQLPGVSVPVTTDPADAETIARFLKLEQDQRRTVRVVVDQLRTPRL